LYLKFEDLFLFESVKYIKSSIRDKEDIKALIREHKELQKENNKTKSDGGWG